MPFGGQLNATDDLKRLEEMPAPEQLDTSPLPLISKAGVLLLLLGAFLFLNASGGATGDLTFHLTGLTPNKGLARVVLYDNPDKYLSEFGFCAADSAKVGADGTADITLHHLPFGKYAGSFYQDENWNFIIDRNLMGLPTEPYGFSNGVQAKWHVPSFQSVTFDFDRSGERQDIVLKYWSKQ